MNISYYFLISFLKRFPPAIKLTDKNRRHFIDQLTYYDLFALFIRWPNRETMRAKNESYMLYIVKHNLKNFSGWQEQATPLRQGINLIKAPLVFGINLIVVLLSWPISILKLLFEVFPLFLAMLCIGGAKLIQQKHATTPTVQVLIGLSKIFQIVYFLLRMVFSPPESAIKMATWGYDYGVGRGNFWWGEDSQAAVYLGIGCGILLAMCSMSISLCAWTAILYVLFFLAPALPVVTFSCIKPMLPFLAEMAIPIGKAMIMPLLSVLPQVLSSGMPPLFAGMAFLISLVPPFLGPPCRMCYHSLIRYWYATEEPLEAISAAKKNSTQSLKGRNLYKDFKKGLEEAKNVAKIAASSLTGSVHSTTHQSSYSSSLWSKEESSDSSEASYATSGSPGIESYTSIKNNK